MIYEFQKARPELDSTVYVAPGVAIVGRVEIDEYSSIWFNTVIRGDVNFVKIGRHTNIQDGSVIHVDTNYSTEIGDYVSAGHKVIIHGSKVGSGCLIGMGAILLDGSVIGENTLIGANSLVREGQVIPARVLAVGTPARVLRELKPEEIKRIRSLAESYSKRAQVFRKEVVLAE